MLIDAATDQHGILSPMLEMKIKSIQSDVALKNLVRKVAISNNISDFYVLSIRLRIIEA